jgi:ubiquinone/menaquinone biosynthesis C-methylase UbiE
MKVAIGTKLQGIKQMDEPPSTFSTFPREYYNRYTNNEWAKAYRQRRWHYASLVRKVRSYHPHIERIADVGCGIGLLTYALANAFDDRTEIISGDISDYAITQTKDRLKAFSNVAVKAINAEEIALPDASTDLIMSMDVVEHLPRPERFVSEAYRVLDSGGLLVFSTPNPGSLGGRLKAKAIAGEQDIHTWFALRDPTHVNVRQIGEWRALCVGTGFLKVADGTDFWWDAPYFRRVPTIAQKLLFSGGTRILSALLPFAPWRLGENYYGIWRKS